MSKKRKISRERVKKLHSKHLSKSSNYDIAYDFATKAYQKFREIIKSIVLFGSVSKNEAVEGSDIDLIIIVDDASIAWDQELIAWYREELGKLIASQNYKKEIHINTVTLSTFWDEVMSGLPVVINIIRYGQPLIDFGGFFEPLKVLLAQGKIRPTPEAIFTTLRRAPEHISRAILGILSSIENLYWAMVDSAHSALMAANQVPPSPEHISEMLEEVFVKTKRLDKKYLEYYNEVYTLTKNILHNNIKEVKGEEIDKHIKKVIEFEEVTRRITTKVIENEKIIRVEEKKNLDFPEYK